MPTHLQLTTPNPARHSISKFPFQQNENRNYHTNNCGLANKRKTCYDCGTSVTKGNG